MSTTTTILIYDDIGPAWLGMISAKEVREQLDAIKDQPAAIRINSGGGDVQEALGMYNAIQQHPGGVTIHIDGVAASSASYVAMAGKRIVAAANAQLMIHSPWTIAMGNADEMRKVAGILDKFGETLSMAYVARTGKPADEIMEAMIDETWFNAAEAKEWGLVDEVGEPLQIAAHIAEGRYKNTPKTLLVDHNERERKRKAEAFQLYAKVVKARFRI